MLFRSFYMMIGVPGSGKSTWIQQFLDSHPEEFVIISSDDLIEEYAQSQNKTYDQVFKEYVGIAEKQMYENAKIAFDKNINVIWDQTNLNPRARSKKLRLVPNRYHMTAVVFSTPGVQEHQRRLDSRTGKTIPQFIIENMIQTMVPPNYEEGFAEIVYITI